MRNGRLFPEPRDLVLAVGQGRADIIPSDDETPVEVDLKSPALGVYSLKPIRAATLAAASASAGAWVPIAAKRGSVVCPRT